MKKTNLINEQEYEILKQAVLYGATSLSEFSKQSGLTLSNAKVIRHRLFKKLGVTSLMDAVHVTIRKGDRLMSKQDFFTDRDYEEVSSKICKFVFLFFQRNNVFSSFHDIAHEFPELNEKTIKDILRFWRDKYYIEEIKNGYECHYRPLAYP